MIATAAFCTHCALQHTCTAPPHGARTHNLCGNTVQSPTTARDAEAHDHGTAQHRNMHRHPSPAGLHQLHMSSCSNRRNRSSCGRSRCSMWTTTMSAGTEHDQQPHSSSRWRRRSGGGGQVDEDEEEEELGVQVSQLCFLYVRIAPRLVAALPSAHDSIFSSSAVPATASGGDDQWRRRRPPPPPTTCRRRCCLQPFSLHPTHLTGSGIVTWGLRK